MKKPKKVKATYVGKIINGDTIRHRFITRAGRQVIFAHTKWCSIGSVYYLEKLKDGFQVSKYPESVDEETWLTDKMLKEYRLDHEAAIGFSKRKRAVARAEKIYFKDMTIEEVRYKIERTDTRSKQYIVDRIKDYLLWGLE